MKYVDDLTLAEGVDMNNQLDSIPLDERTLPEPFRARTGQQLKVKVSKVYKQINLIQEYAETNKMKLNVPKTKFMLFNPCKKFDFLPEFTEFGHSISCGGAEARIFFEERCSMLMSWLFQ